MKITRLQNGGQAGLFSVYTPLPAGAPQSTTSVGDPQGGGSNAGGKKANSDFGAKSLTDLVKDLNGLPVDQDVVINQLQQFYQKEEFFNIAGMETESQLVGRYLRALQIVKRAEHSKKEFDKAYQLAEKNGGLSEVAISSSGQVIVRDKENKLSSMSVEEYKASEGQVQALTNSNLLYMRAHDSNLAYNDELFQVVENGISMQKVTEMIKNAAGNLGSDEMSNYGRSSNIPIIQAIQSGSLSPNDMQAAQAMLQGRYVPGQYKETETIKSSKRQLNQAMSYIMEALPENAKALLKLKSDGTEAGMKTMIFNLLSSSTSEKIDRDSKLEKDMTSEFGTAEAGGNANSERASKDKATATFLHGIQTGMGGELREISIRTNGKGGANLMAKVYGGILTPDDKTIEEGSMFSVLSKSNFSSIADISSASMGGHHLSMDQLKKVVYSGKGLATQELPFIERDGVVVPNFDILDTYANLYVEAKQGAKNEEEIRANLAKLMANHPDMKEYVTADGRIDRRRFKTFAVIEGSTIDESISDGLEQAGKDGYVNINDDPSDDQINAYNNGLKHGLNEQERKDIEDFDESNWYSPNDWLGFHDKLITGNVYIPINANLYNGYLAGKAKQTEVEAQRNNETEYQDRAMRQIEAQNNSSSNL